MTEYEKFLTRFVSAYADSRKLLAVICGGGISLSRIAMVPGSSKVLDAIWMPYSEEETVSWLEQRSVTSEYFSNHAVSGWAAKELWDALAYMHASPNKVAITSALTTNRVRRGENQACIAVENEFGSCEVFHLKLDKLPEEVYSDPIRPWADQKIFHKRQEEDELVATVAIKLATGFEKETLEGEFENGNLRKVI